MKLLRSHRPGPTTADARRRSRCRRSGNGAEYLDRAADEPGHRFDCSATRRNLTVDAGEIPTKPGARLVVGDVELEVVRVAAPCRLLDDGIRPWCRGGVARLIAIALLVLLFMTTAILLC